jgi:solute carrier family 45 protein 1/2/4
MVFGSLVVAFCLFVLGWTAEIVGLFVKDPEKVHFLFTKTLAWLDLCYVEANRDFRQAKNGTIALAVLSIYAVDFSINVGKWQTCPYIN